MDQKVVILSGDMERILDNCGDKNECGDPGTTITWCGYKVSIKRFIPLAAMMQLVNGVVSGCFAESDNSYIPEVRDFFFRCYIVDFYTNVVLPENTEEKNQIVYGTDIVDVILQNIDNGQLRAILDSIDKKINYITNTDMKRIEDNASRLLEQLRTQFDQITDVFSGISDETLTNFVQAVSSLSNESKMQIVGAVKEQHEGGNKQDGLKVLK